jgi:hypothetical protein
MGIPHDVELTILFSLPADIVPPGQHCRAYTGIIVPARLGLTPVSFGIAEF